MTDVQLYTKLSGLPLNYKKELSDYIDSILLHSDKKEKKAKKRIAGQALYENLKIVSKDEHFANYNVTLLWNK
jgi:hypothetical protein